MRLAQISFEELDDSIVLEHDMDDWSPPNASLGIRRGSRAPSSRHGSFSHDITLTRASFSKLIATGDLAASGEDNYAAALASLLGDGISQRKQVKSTSKLTKRLGEEAKEPISIAVTLMHSMDKKKSVFTARTKLEAAGISMSPAAKAAVASARLEAAKAAEATKLDPRYEDNPQNRLKWLKSTPFAVHLKQTELQYLADRVVD
eukprot:1068502-Prymnesium_polylepis.1